MYLHELAMDTFVLMHADSTVAQARPLLNRPGVTHVILVRREPDQTYYYLYPKDTARFILNGVRNEDATLQQVFRLHERDSQSADAYTDHAKVTERVVVLDDGHIVGFYDPAQPTSKSPRRGAAQAHAAPAQPVSRALMADFPDRVQLNAMVPLTISLSAAPVTAGAGSLPMALSVGETIMVLVEPRQGFVVQGNSIAQITIPDDQQTPRQLFLLQATEPGVGKVRVSAFRQGQELGNLELAATVLPATQGVDSTPRRQMQTMVPVRIESPDLSLEIREVTSGSETLITFYLNAANPDLNLNLAPFGPVRLRISPLDYFKEFFSNIESLPLDTDDERRIAERRLAAKGSLLFTSLFPTDLQVLLWSLRPQIKYVQVQSSEPWIPWELCKLEGKENNEIVPGPFLCEAFAMTRWIPGVGIKPTLKLSKIGLVVPGDSGLSYAKAEQEFMQSLATDKRRVEAVPARYLPLTDAMATGEYDGWHFTGHGKFQASDPNGSGIQLEESQTLRPDDLSDTTIKRLGRAKPLVFLNACQLGQSALSLTNIGGWAPQVLRTQAAAFVGAYWSVYDDVAFKFAREFYNRLFGGMAIGQATQEARLAIREGGDPTWLAYTVYAHPLAAVVE